MKRRFLQFLLAASLLVAPGFQKAWADDVTSSAAQSQAQKVTGVVTDGNEPIIGATVKAGEKGAVTDFDGKFTLSVKPGTKITVSYIGYKTVELKSTANMEIVLQEDNVVLSGIVGTGAPVLVNDPAVSIGDYQAYAANPKKLLTLQSEEIAQVDYWLYLEGCDTACYNPVHSQDITLQLGFAGEPVKEGNN